VKQRILSVVLAFMLFFGLLPVTAQAASQDEKDSLYRETRKSYTFATSKSGQSSFHGFCGTMVAYQLRYVGITKSANKADGNKLFDRYKNQEQSTGGFYITPYSGRDYSLEEALNAISCNGTKDVYNILIGFQWTNTEAGGKFGHGVFINGILDGTVYFVESYDSAIGGAEGNVIRLTIPEFARYYNRWTRFDGAIHFTREYAQSLQSWETDLVVRAQSDLVLSSQPAQPGLKESRLLRNVSAGERLQVTQVLQDREGVYYYLVSDGDYTGYIPAGQTLVERFGTEELAVTHLSYEVQLAAGDAMRLYGTVAPRNSGKVRLEAVVTSAMGQEMARVSLEPTAQILDLAQLALPVLPVGRYALELTAYTDTVCVTQEGLQQQEAPQKLLELSYWVGPVPRTGNNQARGLGMGQRNGWYLYGGTWRYYENDAPRTGWFRDQGVSYYLDELGAVTTGWAEVNGQTCLFSATGALCTGWIRVEAGLYYCSEGGRFANGWQVIDGVRYYFLDGILQTEGTYTDGVEVYQLQSDGKAVMLTEE